MLKTYQVFINKSKIHFESKSQPTLPLAFDILKCLSINQRYILKANHNASTVVYKIGLVFINKSKIHFESKSQQIRD